MDVSTSGGPARGFADGVRMALHHAAWVAPLLLPLAYLQSLLLLSPWLGSVQASIIADGAAPWSDWRWHERLESLLALSGGLGGATVLSATGILGWLLLLRIRGPLKSAAPWALHERSHRLHALRLAAGLAGAAAFLILQAPSRRLDRLIDVVTSLRPSAPQSLALLATSQALPLLALGAVLGTTLCLARLAAHRRARAGALAVLAALALVGCTSQLVAATWLKARFDVGASLAAAVGTAGDSQPRLVIALARDRVYHVPVRDGMAGVRFSPESAARANALLDARRGWSALTPDAERFVIAERLLALDPEGARQRALECVLRPGQPATALALLRALGSAAPSPGLRRQLDVLETTPRLHLGPQATLLLARAQARSGDLPRAEASLARLRSGGESAIVAARGGVMIVLSRFVRGQVRGRLLLGDAPFAGRVGLMSTADLFALPRNDDDVQVTWLLRLACATETDAGGAFSFEGLPEGEMALVLLLPSTRGVLPLDAPLPRIEIGRDRPTLDLGDIVLRAGEERSRE